MTELTLKAELESIPKAVAFIDEQLEACGCGMKAQMQIDIAIDELFGNIVHYAYPGENGEATVQFDFDEANRDVSITFADGGVPFDPLQSADPDVSLSAEERKVGGLGIYMVKKSMDRMAYHRKDGLNILTIYKHI